MAQAYLKHLKVENFKSFADLDIELKPFNVLIGANASGKSNFVQIFNFLSDIQKHGLDNAISLQGGIEYVRNFKEDFKKNLVIELEIILPSPSTLRSNRVHQQYHLFYNRVIWKFELSIGKRSGFKIVKDHWNFNIVGFKRDDKQRKEPIFEGSIEFTRKNGRPQFDTFFPDDIITTKDLRYYAFRDDIDSKTLLIKSFIFGFWFRDIVNFFKEFAVYDFDPKLAKRAVPLKGKVALDGDGSNLAIILKSIISNKDSKRKFANLITDLLPFVKSVDTENFADKSILFTLTETYFKDRSLPSSLISDGTINIAALVVALYFQDNSFTIIEEPERNIHPSLISKVISMMNEASTKRQILVTTHSPEIVKWAGLENLFTIKRNKESFSEIFKPIDKEEIKIFLENEMELEELYVQNILNA